MIKGKVRLSPQGQDYIHNPCCSTIVKSILESIDQYSAEIIDVEDSIIRVRLQEETIPEEFIRSNNFAIHKEHLIIFQ
ncbi:hypothetical protein [Spirochaeta isovalerica]|uniref:Uncharacterized protein n=1 Tax=Spirochaeta isovalerica TaxID=150 RepID=A0A841RFW1_9SPIO|nr:hypothetical protein [Spirochaeta isovalerica]MBB6482476.1 hypothetical protein [Spirochaeta isovalerica]